MIGDLMTPKSAKTVILAFVTAGLLCAGALVIPAAGGVAMAQEKKADKKDSKAPMEGRKTQALSKRVYELITEANEKVDAEDYAGALVLLDKIKVMPNLSEYETAQLYTFYGFLYFNAENYKEAIKAYSTVLAQPDLPPAIFQQTIRTLSQLAFVTEDYQLAIKYANQYMEAVGPEPDMYVIIGTAYYQIASDKGDSATGADYDKVIGPVEQAIALSKERGTSAKEQWWLLLRVAYWEKENFSKVRDILEVLVVNWPKKEYWTQLSGMYGELKDERKQLSAYEAAYDQGLLVKSAELIQMAQLFMQAEVPYKGARVLEKGFEAEIIERNVRNLRLQSQAWQLAQEDRKAIPPLKEAAGLSDDGELFARLGQSHLNLSEYKSCITASGKAIKKGGLKNKGNTYLIQGMCQFELDKLTEAKASFRQAVKHEKVAKNARSWISFVESEESRIKQLEKSMRQADEGLTT
jgi:tetratricopeptide (TPR) repeat protein